MKDRKKLKKELQDYYELFNNGKNKLAFRTLMIEGENGSNRHLFDVIAEFPLLERLSISHSSIKKIPLAITKLLHLKSLSFHECRNLRRMPEVLFELKGLEYLNLGFCGITKIPKKLGDLDRLNFLSLEAGRIRKIPEELHLLSQLRHLSLYGNQISVLPNAISNLSSLEFLSVAANRLTEVPASVFNLKKLKVLSLEGNQINNFPPDLLDVLPRLEELRLNGNPIANLPPSITAYNWDRGYNVLDDVKAHFGLA